VISLLSSGDLDDVDAILAATYGRNDYKRTIVVDGYGVRIAVEANHLLIVDGIGSHRRTRRLTRSQSTVQRVLIVGEAGTVSLAALRWCVDTKIALTQVTSQGRILAETVGHSPRESRLRRAQALSATNAAGLEVAKLLISKKITGHAHNLVDRFDDSDSAEHLRELLALVPETASITELRDIESQAAAVYFKTWQRHAVPTFATRDAGRVPQQWLTGNARTSRHWQAGRSPRKATDPVNAMLNYAFALAEVECRIACVAVGLDPALGVMHTDIRHRNSLALDLLETVRPTVEAHVLDFISARRFRAMDFIETADGTCRLTESVTHPITDAMHEWARVIAPIAEQVAHVIGATATTLVRTRTPLTGDRQRAHSSAQKSISSPVSTAGAVKLLPDCIDCGKPLSRSTRKRCGDCERLAKVDRMTARAANGRVARMSAASDPAQTTEARSARVAGITASRAARDAWDASHDVTLADR
jgi:CRISPR-associated endonuclease Cas1